MRLARPVLITCLIFVFNLQFVIGQTTAKVSVLDKDFKTPISNASVYFKQKHIGLYTDENGIFIVPNNLLNSDTVNISNVGYQTQSLTVGNLKSEIYLKSTATILNEVVIKPKGQEIVLGALKPSSHFVQSINQSNLRNEIAFLIENKNGYTGKLMSASIYISPLGKPKTPFRLRIYNSINQKPSLDILTKDVTVQGSTKGGWIEIDLSAHNIHLDQLGVFISMESLYGLKKSSFYHVNNMKTGKSELRYGQNLGLTDEFETATAYQRQFNDEWVPFHLQFPKHISTATFYPMMKIKVKLDE